MAGELDLDTLLNRAPAMRASKLGCEPLQLRLGRTDDVTATGVTQPGKVLRTGHAAIGDPDASDDAMPGFHGVDDRAQCP